MAEWFPLFLTCSLHIKRCEYYSPDRPSKQKETQIRRLKLPIDVRAELVALHTRPECQIEAPTSDSRPQGQLTRPTPQRDLGRAAPGGATSAPSKLLAALPASTAAEVSLPRAEGPRTG